MQDDIVFQVSLVGVIAHVDIGVHITVRDTLVDLAMRRPFGVVITNEIIVVRRQGLVGYEFGVFTGVDKAYVVEMRPDYQVARICRSGCFEGSRVARELCGFCLARSAGFTGPVAMHPFLDSVQIVHIMHQDLKSMAGHQKMAIGSRCIELDVAIPLTLVFYELEVGVIARALGGTQKDLGE
jgi:hypothetical protein